MITQLEDIEVMFITADNGPDGAKKAFSDLEAKLPSLKGRKFYGTFLDEYRACVELLDSDNPNQLGIATAHIPGGQYSRGKVKDWRNNLAEIDTVFDQMAENKKIDSTRPSIEYYRSQDELQLFLPVV